VGVPELVAGLQNVYPLQIIRLGGIHIKYDGEESIDLGGEGENILD
jgi:hypothetical protein